MSAQKTILITGTSNGIGKLLALTLTKQGHRVYASMRGVNGKNAQVANEFQQLAEQNNYDLNVVEMDITDDQGVADAIAAIQAEHPIDVLVNNAALMSVGVSEAFTVEQAKQQMDSNFYSVIRTSRAVLPSMRERKQGLLIHISSNAGRIIVPYFGLYCASKFALEALAESYHYELEPFGVESIIVEPGPHKTELVNTTPTPDDQACLDSYGAHAQVPVQMLDGFKDMFEQQTEATNAQNVADTISGLINQDAPRPLRTTVGADFGTGEINRLVAPIQQQLLASLSPA